MKKVALIAARGGSKRLPGKNVKLLGDIPLIAHTINAAKANGFDEIVVSTDCPQIQRVATDYGASVPFTRPANLASDEASDFDVINHFVNNFDIEDKEYVYFLRPTTLPKMPSIFEKMAAMLINNQFDAVRTVKLVNPKNHPYWTFNFIDGVLSSFVDDISVDTYYQSQLLPDCYALDGVLDAYLVKHIRNEKKLTSPNFGGVVNNEVTFDIDDLSDFDECAAFLARKT